MNLNFSYIKNKIVDFFKKDKNIIFSSIIMGFIITSVITYSAIYSKEIQGGIAREVLRFHVIANSDEDYDQKLKIKVRDEVLNKFKDKMMYCDDLQNTKLFFEANIDEVIKIAEDVIKREGYDYDVNAYIGKSFFPTKNYGDISFPKGEYDALKIEIGKAEGKNWWCVMFPPLCFVDVACNKVSDSSKQKLENVLSDEEYNVVANPENDNSVKVKFKIVELWENIFG